MALGGVSVMTERVSHGENQIIMDTHPSFDYKLSLEDQPTFYTSFFLNHTINA